ncbi:MAG: PEP-CTERM sorting domain-containing protein [Rhodopirellula sp. JB055]|uniref:PEP-CTERM sorting domain-containing protein n=1 Tax=Rhodopirellula sp. JB055 TaxID=3342846 RepID=UPI00370A5F3D
MTLRPLILSLAGLLVFASSAHAAVVTSGTAVFTFNNNSALFSGGGGPLILNRFYGTGVTTATSADLLAGTGGDPITIPGTGLVELSASINGASVSNPTGRSRQTTNLDVDFANVLSTWGAGEQVGIDAVIRHQVDPRDGGGVVGLGDFSLVNNAGTLTLFNNLSFPADAFTIDNAAFTSNADGFTLNGDLLVSGSLAVLTGVTMGTNVGSFSLNVTAVPEPSSMAILGLGSLAAVAYRRRSKAIA